jgi:endoglucanase
MGRSSRPDRRTSLRRWLVAAAVTLVATALGAVAAPGPAAAEVAPGYLLARPIWSDGGWFSAHSLPFSGTPTDSRFWPLESEIMMPHHAQWFSSPNQDQIRGAVSSYVAQSNAWSIPLYTWSVPQLVAYWIPNRDCSSLSAGGAPDLTTYATWITNFANGIKDGLAGHDQPVIVMLEPDALALQYGDAGCHSPTAFDNTARDNAIKAAVDTLHTVAGSNVKVFLDAAHSAWYGSNPSAMADRLVAGGIAQADGFFTNASNYQSTANEKNYGNSLRTALTARGVAGKQQIIDTSRNGVGPGPDVQGNGWPNWCDNVNAKLGQAPTLNTGDPNIAGYLWIKPPGETDGCFGGSNTTGGNLPTNGLPAGTFSAERACQLVPGNCVYDVHVAATPAGLTVTKAAGRIVVEWGPSLGACNYGLSLNGSATAVVGPGELWWVDLNPSPGTHTYRVNAVTGNCRGLPPATSPWSATVSVTV